MQTTTSSQDSDKKASHRRKRDDEEEANADDGATAKSSKRSRQATPPPGSSSSSTAVSATTTTTSTTSSSSSSSGAKKVKAKSTKPEFKKYAFPGISLTSHNDTKFTNADFKGSKYTLVSLYVNITRASCKKQILELISMQKHFKEYHTQLVAISTEDKEKLAKFAKANKIDIPILSDPDHSIMAALHAWKPKKAFHGMQSKGDGVERASFVVDQSGQVVDEIRRHRPVGFSKRAIKAVAHVQGVRVPSAIFKKKGGSSKAKGSSKKSAKKSKDEKEDDDDDKGSSSEGKSSSEEDGKGSSGSDEKSSSDDDDDKKKKISKKK